MYADGATPWPDVADLDVIRRVRRNDKMARPERCPAAVYAVMVQCWDLNPTARPTAAEVEHQLRTMGSGGSAPPQPQTGSTGEPSRALQLVSSRDGAGHPRTESDAYMDRVNAAVPARSVSMLDNSDDDDEEDELDRDEGYHL